MLLFKYQKFNQFERVFFNVSQSDKVGLFCHKFVMNLPWILDLFCFQDSKREAMCKILALFYFCLGEDPILPRLLTSPSLLVCSSEIIAKNRPPKVAAYFLFYMPAF